jgi:Protein of unknown function (DUF1573)
MDALRNDDSQAAPPCCGGIRLVLLASALLPFGWAVGQRMTGSAAAAVEPAVQRPGLVFHQFLVDLGRVPLMKTVGARFWFTNHGRTPVEILKLEPSCGCLSPRLQKRVYQPGESGEIILPVETPNQAPGPHEYRVRVKYTDPDPNETTLTFRVTLPEQQVMVEPRSMMVYLLGTGDVMRTLAVTDYPDFGLKLTAVRCDLDWVAVELGKTVKGPAGHERHLVYVTVPGNAPKGRFRAIVSISTDHPKYPVIRVPMIVTKAERLPERSARRRGKPNERR